MATGEPTGWSPSARALAAAKLMLGWVALLWTLQALDLATGGGLHTYGITPRQPAELRDVIPAAFLHHGFEHVAANTVPLLILGFLAALSGIRRFLAVAATIIVVSGLGIWLTSPDNSITAGASGVVFGLFGYLLVRGFVNRKPLEVVIGLVVAALYGSLIWGVLPTDAAISWQGHLFGLLGGAAAAFLFRDPPRRPAATGPGAW
ncbi:rhomboid family intramembrane serine protease [Streptomyces sp. PR69]|uniref:rhomboid family intramembrane serine protease n=1 Tax=Streptomyces sp. PR69 TaxID=2984950 RepID=UPI002264D113|nr:rhomboid family intramembrane serine protease [Streptomyces sp. PR69]